MQTKFIWKGMVAKDITVYYEIVWYIRVFYGILRYFMIYYGTTVGNWNEKP